MRELKIGDTVIFEHRNYRYRLAKIINEAQVSDHDRELGNGLIEILPLKGWFRRARWIKTSYIVGKLP